MALFVGLDLLATVVPDYARDSIRGAGLPEVLWINTEPLGGDLISTEPAKPTSGGLALRYRLTPGLLAKIRLQVESMDAAAEAGRFDRDKAQTAAQRLQDLEDWARGACDAGNPEWPAGPPATPVGWWNAESAVGPLPPPVMTRDRVAALRGQADSLGQATPNGCSRWAATCGYIPLGESPLEESEGVE